MVVVLITSCMTTPINLAFESKGKTEMIWNYFNLTVDILFLVDIIVIFNSAVYN